MAHRLTRVPAWQLCPADAAAAELVVPAPLVCDHCSAEAAGTDDAGAGRAGACARRGQVDRSQGDQSQLRAALGEPSGPGSVLLLTVQPMIGANMHPTFQARRALPPALTRVAQQHAWVPAPLSRPLAPLAAAAAGGRSRVSGGKWAGPLVGQAFGHQRDYLHLGSSRAVSQSLTPLLPCSAASKAQPAGKQLTMRS